MCLTRPAWAASCGPCRRCLCRAASSPRSASCRGPRGRLRRGRRVTRTRRAPRSPRAPRAPYPRPKERSRDRRDSGEVFRISRHPGSMPAATRREQWTLRRAVARRPDTASIASFPGGHLGQDGDGSVPSYTFDAEPATAGTTRSPGPAGSPARCWLSAGPVARRPVRSQPHRLPAPSRWLWRTALLTRSATGCP